MGINRFISIIMRLNFIDVLTLICWLRSKAENNNDYV